MDAEEDGDAVVAVRHIGGHALLQGEGGREEREEGEREKEKDFLSFNTPLL